MSRSRKRLLAALLAVGLVSPGLVSRVSAQATVNPIPPEDASLAGGQDIYAQYCAVCHGVQGRGDGPLSRTMVPRPADFRIHMAEGHTDAELFDWISNGMPDSAMPGFADQLSEDERWNVLNFMKGFAPASQ